MFQTKKHVRPVYVIFMGILATIVSFFIMKLIDYMMEYRMTFKKYEMKQKYEQDYKDYFTELNSIVNKFKCKITFYYILTTIFTLLMWYIVSSFIGTYYHCLQAWGLMILVNVVISLVFPFIFYFLGVYFQWKGIQNEKFGFYKAGMIMIKM